MGQHIFDRLRDLRRNVIPVVGAGLAAASGAPTSNQLIAALSEAAAIEPPQGADLFALADRLEAERGTQWVQNIVADEVSGAHIVPCPALLAVTLIPGRLAATTNYDTSVELAAERHGLISVTLTPQNLRDVLSEGDESRFLVLHLHGVASEPASLILTKSTYQDALADDALALAVRSLATAKTLVFMGHSMATREEHLRRDLDLTTRLFGAGGHVLLRAEDEAAAVDAPQFLADTGIEVAAFPNDDRSYRFVLQAAQVLGAPPLIPSQAEAARSSLPMEPAYCPMEVAPAAEVADESKRAVWRYGRYLGTHITKATDVNASRVLLYGAPGAGKTQTLLRLAQASPDPALHLPLGGVTPPGTGEAVEPVFINWMRDARSLGAGVPQVTATTLRDVAYAFFLDGLDEVPPDRRPGVIAALSELAQRWPHHRWLVASRRVPELDGGVLQGFEEYELVASHEWLIDFAAQRGVDIERLDDFANTAPGMSELIEIPLYAAAAVQAILEDRPVPTSPLELLLDLAAHGLREEETRARTDLAHIDRWLDRLCLVMLAAHADDVEADEASCAPLRGPVERDVTVNWLVTRVLLREQNGRVRPLVRPLRDARAARALIDHPQAEDLLQDFAVAEVGGERHLRPEWQYAVDLLLGSDLPRWRPLVEPVDRLSVARAVPLTAPRSDRDAAISTIWAWYRDKRLHIPRTREGQLRNDLDALVGLAQEGLSDKLRAELVAALGADDMAVRGNAVAILARVEQGQSLRGRLLDVLDDPAPVVRRRAAEAVDRLRLSRYSSRLMDKALEDADDLARRTLASVALEVAEDEEFEHLVARLPELLRTGTQLTINRRWSRDRQLRFVVGLPHPPGDWLEDLARRTDDPWTEDDVERLAEAWLRSDPTRTGEHVRAALLAHPEAALRGSFRAGADEPDLFDVAFLLDSLSEEQVRALAADGSSRAADLIQRYMEWRFAGPQEPAQPRPPRPPLELPSLDALIEAGDLDTIARTSTAAAGTLTPSQRSALLELVQTAWTSNDDGSTPITRIEVVGEGQWFEAERDWRLLALAGNLRMPLSEDEWYRLADLGRPGDDDWLDATFVQSWTSSIEARIDPLGEPGLEAVTRSAPLTAAVAERIADRCLGSQNEELRRVFADRLAALGHADILRARVTRLPSKELDIALIRAGDEAAERRLLTDFLHRGCPALKRWDGDLTWVDEVAHEASGPLVVACLTVMLRRGDEPHHLTALFNALVRTNGEHSLGAYDRLMSDPTIPDAAFLWYRRQEAIVQLSAPPQARVADIASSMFPTQGTDDV